MDNEFKLWQHCVIETLKYGSITLYQALTIFIKEGLYPFILKKKYNFSINKQDFGNILASTMFNYLIDKMYLFPTVNGVNFSDEYFQYFEYKISDEEWDAFWNYWDKELDNLFDHKYDSRLTLQIKHIVWMFIDLEKSPAHQEYEDMNNAIDEIEANEQENYNRKVDPYILDQMNAINHPKFVRFEI